MKYLLSLTFILSMVGVSAHAQIPPPPPLIYRAPEKYELKEFTPEDKTFKITFPGAPKITKQKAENSSTVNYRVSRQGSSSVVTVTDFNVDVENAKEQVYEVVRANWLKVPKSKIETEKDVEIDGKEGKEFEVLFDYEYHKIRILIVGKRVYELNSGVTNWHILKKYNADKVAEFENETERFFSSFKIINSPEEAKIRVPVDFAGTSAAAPFRLDTQKDKGLKSPEKLSEV